MLANLVCASVTADPHECLHINSTVFHTIREHGRERRTSMGPRKSTLSRLTKSQPSAMSELARGTHNSSQPSQIYNRADHPHPKQSLADALLSNLLRREQLETTKDREYKRLVHMEAHVSQLEGFASDTKAWEVYNAVCNEFRKEAQDVRVSIAVLDEELESMRAETEAQEETYDDVDRQERIEEYEKLIYKAKERMKRDAVIVKQSEREVSRLAKDFGSWRGQPDGERTPSPGVSYS